MSGMTRLFDIHLSIANRGAAAASSLIIPSRWLGETKYKARDAKPPFQRCCFAYKSGRYDASMLISSLA